MFAQSMRVGVVLLALAAMLPPHAAAQTPDQAAIHRGAVDVYLQTGDIARAVRPLQSFKTQDFERAVDALVASRDVTRMRAAAVFHLDIGVALAGLSAAATKLHLDIGKSLLEKLSDLNKRGVRVDDVATFRAIWLAVAGSTFLSIRDTQHAMPYLRDAIALAPKSAHVVTVSGIAYEVDAAGWNPDDWQTLSQRERNHRERIYLLGKAEAAYRDALRLDPEYALASIRLGRVLQMNGKLTEAREALDRGVVGARGDFQQYVGSLHMGSLLAEMKDFAGARRAYERAAAIAPWSQPAIVGLAHVELMQGRPDLSQALIRSFTAGKETDVVWWAFKDGSLDVPGLAWLRERARQ